MLLNRGDGSFLTGSELEATSGYPSLAIGDLNADGKLDLVTKDGSIFLNKGDATFQRRDYPQGFGESFALGDLNGDGKPDLVSATYGEVSVFANRGGGSFLTALDYPTGRSSDSSSAAVGDVNGDGKPDLVVANADGAVSVLVETPGLCNVQDVVRLTLAAATQKLARARCSVGKVRRVYDTFRIAKGLVDGQNPRPGAVLPAATKVSLTLSRGPKPKSKRR